MSDPEETDYDYDGPLEVAIARARSWLRAAPGRPVGPLADVDAMVAAFDQPLPDEGTDSAAVIELMAARAEPGLMAISSGRFFGWVMGGLHPAGLAADWLVSAWDQNNGLRYATPAAAAIEQVAAQWLLDLFGLPRGASVGFVTGGTMANFTCVAAARGCVLDRAGWDLERDGLTGAPRVHVLVGAERHDTIDLSMRYLGLGRPHVVDADEQGRLRVDALRAALATIPAEEPVIVCLQAGNVHSGSFDPFADAIAAAHDRGAWVHVDGAFGLWAAASPPLQDLVVGMAAADSWSTDAHKTLNTPYDCGIAIVADPVAMQAAFGVHASYLIADASAPDPLDLVPELSRRARGIPVWAVLSALGRTGVADRVATLATRARQFADEVAAIPGARVLNDVVYTQVCLAFENDERTAAVGRRLIEDGTAWISGSHWAGREVLRISVSNYVTSAADITRTVDALRRAAAG